MYRLRVLPEGRVITTEKPQNLLDLLRREGLAPDAPCGGEGKCGKCRVTVDGKETLACQTMVDRDMTVTLPQRSAMRILLGREDSIGKPDPVQPGHLIAFDIGTTSVVCALLDAITGKELACVGRKNPQSVYGADVISRIRAALGGALNRQTLLIRDTMTSLIRQVCAQAAVREEEIGVICVVGNPAMQQLFLGISPENLATIPFAPALTESTVSSCENVFPLCPNARLLTVPDISGYVGADTVGCILATELHKKEELTLLVDIGTNGEMVLGDRNGLIACSTAAGPALEGAGIQCGMTAAPGAIDHVWIEGRTLRCSVIGNTKATGICGSGLIDAVATGLRLGLINRRGRILTEDHTLPVTDDISLTQEDIRQLQLAKGAIHAGIRLMTSQMGVELGDIKQVLLAGAFGTFLDPENACRIGLLPEELSGRISAVGNAALSGAKLLALDQKLLKEANDLVKQIRFLELASLPEFSGTFARSMGFREGA